MRSCQRVLEHWCHVAGYRRIGVQWANGARNTTATSCPPKSGGALLCDDSFPVCVWRGPGSRTGDSIIAQANGPHINRAVIGSQWSSVSIALCIVTRQAAPTGNVAPTAQRKTWLRATVDLAAEANGSHPKRRLPMIPPSQLVLPKPSSFCLKHDMPLQLAAVVD